MRSGRAAPCATGGEAVGKRAIDDPQPDLGTLLGTIAADAKTLLAQQVELFRAEVGHELRKAGGAAAAVAAGGGLAVAGGLLAGFAAAHLAARVTRLPLWAGYGLAAGGLGAAGVKLLLAGRDGFAGLRPLHQTTAALGENAEWLAEQLGPVGG